MAKSDRSRPAKPPTGRPTPGSGPSGRTPPPRRTAPPPGAPPARAAPRPEAPRTRLKQAGKPRAPRAAPQGNTTPVTDQPPVWKRLWDWLLEDPSKAKREGPTEREKAERLVAERDRAARQALIASAFRRKGRKRPVEGVTLAAPAPWPRAPLVAPRPKAAPRPKPMAAAPAAVAGGSVAPPKTKKTLPVVALWRKMLGERETVDAEGGKTIVPPPETDWRWHLHRFFRSNVRAVAYTRGLLLLFLVLSSAWVSLYATTGFDYTDLMRPADPEDPRDAYKLPFFIIESGSMMHHDASWGRVGTIDPGDLIIIEKYHPGMEIETFYGRGDRHVAGGKGDVIMYLPPECRNCPPPQPIIHRAVAYVQRDQLPVRDPATGANVFRDLFTVEEFGIVSASTITIPELGLYDYAPTSSGYITRGDNQRSNNWADQALGITPFPIAEDRIIGRMKAEVPVVGLAKIALTGQDPGVLSVDDQWCAFLAGKAACDTWVLFFIVMILVVGVPLVLTTVFFARRWWQRRLDLMALQARQAEAAAPPRTDDPAEGAEGAALPFIVHDATDLLAGKVRVGPAAPAPGPASWDDLTRTRVRLDDA